MSLPCTQWGTLSGLCTQWGTGEERRISAMYPVGDAQWLMYPVGDKGGEENHCHVPSGGHSVTHVPSGRQGAEENLCHVPSGGHSVAYVPIGGRGRRGGSLACTQWGTLSGLCTQWGIREERRITAMYPVGDTQ